MIFLLLDFNTTTSSDLSSSFSSQTSSQAFSIFLKFSNAIFQLSDRLVNYKLLYNHFYTAAHLKMIFEVVKNLSQKIDN